MYNVESVPNILSVIILCNLERTYIFEHLEVRRYSRRQIQQNFQPGRKPLCCNYLIRGMETSTRALALDDKSKDEIGRLDERNAGDFVTARSLEKFR